MNTTQVKITGRNKELFQNFLEKALNIATMIARKGVLPDAYHLEEKNLDRLGEWWVLHDKTYNILGTVNNHKAFIRDQGENAITLEFSYRYDPFPGKGLRYAEIVPTVIAFILGENAEIIIK